MNPFMESEKLLISRGNPRTLAYTSDRPLPTTTGRAMPNELPQKPSPSIAHRFRAQLKQRDDEFRVSGLDVAPLPTTEDIVQLYELMLSELTFNSKPIITDLTVLAEEQREHGKGIADLICSRILEVPVDQKLPSLYLLDSIVKNVGHEYINYFSSRLPEVFCEAYRQVHPNLHNAMRHLFGTWSTVFPPSILRKIEARLSQLTTQETSALTSSRASESPRPTHGIHVNPKYLRQLEHSVGDKLLALQHIPEARGASTLKVHDKKLAPGYEEYDYDHADGLEHGGSQAFNSMGSMSHDSFSLGTNKANIKLAKSSLSSRIGHNGPLQSVGDELETVRASPSQNVYDYEGFRMINRNEDTNKWRRKQYPDDNINGLESTSFNIRNGCALEGPRALIEAYGSDKGKGYLNDNPPQAEHFSMNGIDNKMTPVTWQNTEEEEFDWEDMSPTLADRGRSNDMSKPPVPPSRFRTRLGFDRSNVMSIEPGMRNNSSHQDVWSMHSHLSQTSQNLVSTKGTGGNFQIPLLGRGIASSGGEKMSPFVDKLPTNDALHRPTVASRLGSSALDSSMESQSVVQSMGQRHPVNLSDSCPPSRPPFHVPGHNKSQFESLNGSNAFINRANRSFFPEQQMNNVRNKELSHTTKSPQVGNQHGGRILLTQGNQLQTIPLKPQFLPSQDMHDSFSASAVPPVLPHLMAPSLSQGYSSQGLRPGISECLSSSVPIGQWNLPVHNSPSNPLHLQGPLPPLPAGPHPTISQKAGSLVPGQQPGTAFSGLISSLMAQGLISLNNKAPVQDSVGVEFNPDVLKVRHDSAITALYADLPRQCMTCGLRFKTQEEHSNHMDWHVTRNRMSKSRKQKPSRKWFVSTSMWLSGAEALGTEAVPGFLPAEVIVEKKDDEELAVPADEDQKTCALCGEPFDDFYSDETEEWMYRGAVYMNAPDGQTAGMDRSQLGPIVHAKCRTESNVVPSESFDQDEQRGVSEEGSQRKRLRS
ncbi:polyadenylation and cleavage factor homolog 4-like isoform X1 [Cucurbita maxima]|uniref:Polyadenylation and cleavage factor homolog 4-like isoform X1 n=1 Tax=Cucurbita maxima TaxID=3661 RepID=A0A6J1KKK6_CUCMA|nr:polyadenylation and cleavage factor homolog 4-like isoform X1 [Cucurbita maxima]